MTLSPGTRLGPYEVLALIGAGGMGEVYRALDTRLNRSVALKIVSDRWRDRPDLRARFRVEAEAIAALGHPHICQLFDVGQHDDIDFLVLEYVEGETLTARLARRPLPLATALEYATAMADALGHAHRRGIVHRDVKPANVILTKEGLKLLDFGLARVIDRPAVTSTSTLAAASDPLTQTGVALGTWQYMAPEQIRGGPVDTRTDVFALGAVIYEMLAGRRPFDGVTHHDLITAILTLDPPDLRAANPSVPQGVAQIVRTALAKEPDDRWQDARDLTRALEAVEVPGPLSSNARARPGRGTLTAAFILCGISLAAGAALWAVLGRPEPLAAPAVTRLSVPLTGAEPYFGSLALTPDGRNLVYRAGRFGDNWLYMRRMDQLDATRIDGTRGGYFPFFSPDGRWMGFTAQNQLRKIRLTGGEEAVTLSKVQTFGSSGGSSWNPDGTIVFSTVMGPGLMRVPENGGTPEQLTTRQPGERVHVNPHFLPDGKAVLFTVSTTDTSTYDQARIEVVELDTGARRVVLEGARWARYVASGHLVYARAGSLFTVPFDLTRRQVTGEPVPVSSGVSMEGYVVHGDVSDAEVAAYVPAESPPETNRRLVWISRRGEVQPVRPEPGYYLSPRVSPDGQFVATVVQSPNNTLWVYDIGRAMFTRVPAKGDASPAWTPDSRALVYSAWQAPGDVLILAAIDGHREQVLLRSSAAAVDSDAVAPDGTLAIATITSDKTQSDLWVVPLTGSGKPWPLLQSPAVEFRARMSPDGRWFAYVSNEAGPVQYQVYVRPFRGAGGRQQISTDGGNAVVWAASGREIFYRAGNRMMAVDVRPGPSFEAGPPRLLFSLSGRFHDGFDVSPDGQRFIMVQEIESQPATQINVVLNWVEDVRRRQAGVK